MKFIDAIFLKPGPAITEGSADSLKDSLVEGGEIGITFEVGK